MLEKSTFMAEKSTNFVGVSHDQGQPAPSKTWMEDCTKEPTVYTKHDTEHNMFHANDLCKSAKHVKNLLTRQKIYKILYFAALTKP